MNRAPVASRNDLPASSRWMRPGCAFKRYVRPSIPIYLSTLQPLFHFDTISRANKKMRGQERNTGGGPVWLDGRLFR